MIIKLITPAGSMNVEANKTALLTPHFKLEELANNAGDPKLPQYIYGPDQIRFLRCLEEFRERCKAPVIVNSGYRQEAYNKKIGGDKNSPHLQALAVDIKPVKGWTRDMHARLWLRCLYDNALIGAINLYPESSGYYHLEALSDLVYGYKQSRIRVYSMTDKARYDSMFALAPVDVVKN